MLSGKRMLLEKIIEIIVHSPSSDLIEWKTSLLMMIAFPAGTFMISYFYDVVTNGINGISFTHNINFDFLVPVPGNVI